MLLLLVNSSLALCCPKVLIKTYVDRAVHGCTVCQNGSPHHVLHATNNTLRCHFRTIWHNLCISFTMALQDAKDVFFTIRFTASVTSNSLCTKIGFLDIFKTLERRFRLMAFGNSLQRFKVNAFDGSDRNANHSAVLIAVKSREKLQICCLKPAFLIR